MGCDPQCTNAQENTSRNTAALTRYPELFVYLRRHHILLSLLSLIPRSLSVHPFWAIQANIVWQSTSHADQCCNSLPWKPEISIAYLEQSTVENTLVTVEQAAKVWPNVSAPHQNKHYSIWAAIVIHKLELTLFLVFQSIGEHLNLQHIGPSPSRHHLSLWYSICCMFEHVGAVFPSYFGPKVGETFIADENQ